MEFRLKLGGDRKRSSPNFGLVLVLKSTYHYPIEKFNRTHNACTFRVFRPPELGYDVLLTPSRRPCLKFSFQASKLRADQQLDTLYSIETVISICAFRILICKTFPLSKHIKYHLAEYFHKSIKPFMEKEINVFILS